MPDEVRVLREPTGVDIERHPVAAADLGDGAHVRHRYRLATTRVVGDRQHHERDLVRTLPVEQVLQRLDVHVAFERMRRRCVV